MVNQDDFLRSASILSLECFVILCSVVLMCFNAVFNITYECVYEYNTAYFYIASVISIFTLTTNHVPPSPQVKSSGRRAYRDGR